MTPPTLTPSEEILGRELGGFDFGLMHRNAMIAASGGSSRFKMPGLRKTGTTICGVVFEGGIVLGADTRATEGTVVSDKNCEKIHYIAPNIYCCGAGTAADTIHLTNLIASQCELLRLSTGSSTRIVTAVTMLKRRLFQYQGHISAYLVLGGVDVTGAHLYSVHAHGSTDKLPYVTMGSGSLAAMAVMEAGYKDGMTEAEGINLVSAAIRAGIFNDLGSGSNVDLTVIRVPKETGAAPDVEIMRNYQTPNDVAPFRAKIVRPPARIIPRGATVVVAETFTPSLSKPTIAASAAAAAAAQTTGSGDIGVSESKMETD